MFTLVAGLGILNLVTGVMVQAAFRVVADESHENASMMLNELKVEFRQAVKRVYAAWESKQDKTKKRIRGMVVAILDEYKKKVVKATTLHRKKTLRGRGSKSRMSSPSATHGDSFAQSVQTDISASPSPEQEDDVEEQGDGQDVKHEAVSFVDKNTCFIITSLWITKFEVAIRYKLKFESQEQSDAYGKPKDSMLMWEGGSRTADLHFNEEKRALGKSYSALSVGTTSVPEDHTSSTESSGILVFGGLSAGKTLKFRFGSMYSWVVITPNGHDLNRRIAEASRDWQQDKHRGFLGKSSTWLDVLTKHGILEQLHTAPSGLDPELIGYAELEDVLQDRKLNAIMDTVGLRPEHVLLTFGELNVTGEPVLRVSDLVEGVVRLHRQMVGIDVARSKSVMRRWISEMAELEEVAEQCQKEFEGIVRSLREFEYKPELLKEQEVIDLAEQGAELRRRDSFQTGSDYAWLRDVMQARQFGDRTHTSRVSGERAKVYNAGQAEEDSPAQGAGEVPSPDTPAVDGEASFSVQRGRSDMELSEVSHRNTAEEALEDQVLSAAAEPVAGAAGGAAPTPPTTTQPLASRSDASQMTWRRGLARQGPQRWPEDPVDLAVGAVSIAEANDLLRQKVQSRRETVRRRMTRVNLPNEVISRIFAQSSARLGLETSAESRYYNMEDDKLSICSAEENWE